MATYDDFNSQPVRQIWEGIQGRVITGERMTMALVDLEPNVELAQHHHENEQMGFIIQGQMTFTIGGETRTLGPGDTYSIKSDTPHHGSTGPEGCVVIDVFAPVRSDWEKLERSEARPSSWRMDR
ncbi:MAG: cupin domain-containing protein [Candidatus Dormibacteraeota bacterium]|nr:cupin domain-containing protein [Candidatus Dormibacteraeota bacterium]